MDTHMNIKSILAMVLVIAMLFSLCACGEQPATEPSLTEGSNVSVESEEITITDMIGREVTVVPGSYKRVVCIGAGALRMYSYIGDVALLCGVEDIDNTTLSERPMMFDSVARPYVLAYGDTFNVLPSCGVGGPMAQTAEAEKILSCNPDIVISVGQAGGRSGITPERIAINIDDARIPDNETKQPIDIPIFEDGENAYFTNLPIKAMIEEMKLAEIPCSISNTAGTFVCNHVMYGILYMASKKYPNIKGGFIHVPYIPAQVLDKPNMPSMSIENIAKGLELCIKVAVTKNDDIKITGGAIC